MVTKIIFSVFLPLAILLLTSCKETATTPPTKQAKSPNKVITIGLIPERNLFDQIERYKPIADYISKKTETTIDLKVLTRYGNIIDNFVELNLDGAFFGSFTYALAHARLGVEPIVRPETADGISTYYGLIFVRKDSGIKNPAQMKDKVFAFVDKATTAGYLLPLAYFKKHDIKNYKTYFKETYFAGTHEDSIYDVLNKKADIGAAKNTVFFNLAQTDQRIKDELLILERSPDVPQNGLALKKDIASSIRAKMKEAFLNMHKEPEGKIVLEKFGADRFIETVDNDYLGVYQYANEIRLDLVTYDYIND